MPDTVPLGGDYNGDVATPNLLRILRPEVVSYIRSKVLLADKFSDRLDLVRKLIIDEQNDQPISYRSESVGWAVGSNIAETENSLLFPHPDQIPELVSNLGTIFQIVTQQIERLRETAEVDLDLEQQARLFTLIYVLQLIVHPYSNENKRTAYAMAFTYLMECGASPHSLSLFKPEETTYINLRGTGGFYSTQCARTAPLELLVQSEEVTYILTKYHKLLSAYFHTHEISSDMFEILRYYLSYIKENFGDAVVTHYIDPYQTSEFSYQKSYQYLKTKYPNIPGDVALAIITLIRFRRQLGVQIPDTPNSYIYKIIEAESILKSLQKYNVSTEQARQVLNQAPLKSSMLIRSVVQSTPLPNLLAYVFEGLNTASKIDNFTDTGLPIASENLKDWLITAEEQIRIKVGLGPLTIDTELFTES